MVGLKSSANHLNSWISNLRTDSATLRILEAVSDFVHRFAQCLLSVLSEDKGCLPTNPALAELGLGSTVAIELHFWRKQSSSLAIPVSKISVMGSLKALS
ncbi:hypothetical protein COCSADRAFT_287456 [Bipolaris sorokiniana ND90Pr]|uniref:Carrier domain-containing protein n=1 Tax=Cochliobolus sativus (strain ND90Pr / ATCC 201652) TaxID=665912 RepID=M2TDA4_COCSN|nr:uncharacterized protein COCSADRAFT_287456 [Bipolaris sorokiniana ND90Pr]EMD67221.1 hypothetical protein COCSADRAFT_287456 [Bipolaris sorokiniana ND90Pr]